MATEPLLAEKLETVSELVVVPARANGVFPELAGQDHAEGSSGVDFVEGLREIDPFAVRPVREEIGVGVFSSRLGVLKGANSVDACRLVAVRATSEPPLFHGNRLLMVEGLMGSLEPLSSTKVQSAMQPSVTMR
jgi:hypothetical protein